MHFHLPQPLHGWREFAGKVGVTVLGLLIAIGLEQTVESIRCAARCTTRKPRSMTTSAKPTARSLIASRSTIASRVAAVCSPL